MTEDTLLMIPGPTNVPPAVLEAIGAPTMYHRGADFAAMLDRCTKGLQEVFQTKGDVVILSASGTGGDEAAITNLIERDDRVIAVNGGKFGKRMGLIAERLGALVTWVNIEPGKAVEPQQIAGLLADSPFKALLFVQNETSTGVCQNVSTMARIARDYGCLTIVDCVSGMAGIPVRTDQWGLDAVVAGSQKAFMLPPGLAFVALSDRAWQIAESCKTPRFYLDLIAARKALHKGQTPYTPSVNLMRGLDASLKIILEEGIEAVWTRHAKAARAMRAGMHALGLQVFADSAYASNVVTAVAAPEGVDSSALVKAVLADANILISGGQDELKGKIFRVAHMGMFTLEDLTRTAAAIGKALGDLGHPCDPDKAVAAIHAVYG